MKSLKIKVNDGVVEKVIKIELSEKEYEKLMSIYDDEFGLEMIILDEEDVMVAAL